MSTHEKPPHIPAGGWSWVKKGSQIGLQVDHQPGIDHLNRPYLSPSSAKSFSKDSCSARAAAEKLLRSRPLPTDATELGTNFHSVAEELYKLDPFRRTQGTAMDLLLGICDGVIRPGPAGSRSRADWADLLVKTHNVGWGLFQIEDPTTLNVIATEEKISDVEIAGVPFRGIIDRVRETEDGDQIIGDYKTGKMPANITQFGDDHGDQLRLYFMAKKELGAPVTGAEILYTNGKYGKSKKVAVSNQKLAATRTGFKRAWTIFSTAMETGYFNTTESALCGWCPLVKSCPTAAKHGKEDRSGKGIDGLTIEDHTGGVRRITKAAMMADPDAGVPAEWRNILDTATTKPAADTADTTAVAADVPAEWRSILDTATDDTPDMPSTPARRTPEGQATTTTEEHPMEANEIPVLIEGKPYEETVDSALNPNSYAAGAVWSLTIEAAKQLHNAKARMNKTNLTLVTDILAEVCAKVVNQITEEPDNLQGGAHTRARHALFASLRMTPLPWGQDAVAWASWMKTTVNRCKAMSDAAILLHANGHSKPDFDALAGIAVPLPEQDGLRVVA